MIAVTHYSNSDSLYFALKELREKILRSNINFDFFLFAIHSKYGYEDVTYFINKFFKTDNWIAFHAIDAFSNTAIVDGISVLCLKFERNGKLSKFFIDDIADTSALEKTAEYLNKNTNKIHIIFSGSCGHETSFFIENLRKLLNYRPVNNIIGGISSGFEDNGEVLTYQFVDNKVIKNGFVILSFDNFDFEIGISLGFRPYGIAYTVSKASGYRVYEVDDDKNFSYLIQNLMKGVENDVRNLWYCPINILDENDGYVATLRTFRKVEKDYVEFFGPVKEGQRFKFSYGDKDEILEEDRRVALKVKKSIRYPDVILNFSCIARQFVLEDLNHVENEIYTQVLNAPLFGFFTFGEIGPDKFFKSLKFYNQTSLLVALREKQ